MAHKPPTQKKPWQINPPIPRIGSGRPSTYNDDIAMRICERIAAGLGLEPISRDPDMPALITIYDWMAKHEFFAEGVARARKIRADTYAESIVPIADTPTISTRTRAKADGSVVDIITFDNPERSKQQIEARKWLAGKDDPDRYGDRLEINQTTNLTITVVDQLREARERIANARASIRVVDRCSEEQGAIDVTPASSNTLVADSQPGQALDIVED